MVGVIFRLHWWKWSVIIRYFLSMRTEIYKYIFAIFRLHGRKFTVINHCFSEDGNLWANCGPLKTKTAEDRWWLDNSGITILRTSHLMDWSTVDIASTSSNLLLLVFETSQTNEYEKANKYAYLKTKTYITKAFMVLVIFNIFTATVSSSICELTSLHTICELSSYQVNPIDIL